MRARIRATVTTGPPAPPPIPLLEADDLPGDEDWTLLSGFARDDVDGCEVSVQPEFD